ncbi:uncharacterized protein NEMAJ01_0843 [Nematocida major]|uniref:uncharacterized protein n=1 Tax=Nematocida major TaxID=1912982 RepID=UPI0020075FA1|nr:uncharacterized protein NEMAJ01_0843 [Nematocida major]KAH9385947.1 hypothetical protein NEMAJ01_0843 [Nematocida major]
MLLDIEERVLPEFAALLQMEIGEKTEPSEILSKLTDSAMQKVEHMQLIGKDQLLGASKLRSERVIYSAVITAVYTKILKDSPGRIVEVIPYIQERIRDRDRRIRGNVVSFIFRNIQVVKDEGVETRGIAKTIIDLLKNKKKTVRIFYLRLVASNTNEFAELLDPTNVKYLINTIALLCECHLSEGLHKSAVGTIKKMVSIINRLKYLGKILLLNVFPLFEACDFSLPALHPILKGFYRKCKKEIGNVAYLKFIEDHKKEKTTGHIYKNLLLLLELGVNERAQVFERYRAAIDSVQSQEMKIEALRIIRESKHNPNRALYLEEVLSIIKGMDSHTSPEIAEAVLPAYMEYAKDGVVSPEKFKETVFALFSDCPGSRIPILEFLNAFLKDVPVPGGFLCAPGASLQNTASTLNPSGLPMASTQSLIGISADFSGLHALAEEDARKPLGADRGGSATGKHAQQEGAILEKPAQGETCHAALPKIARAARELVCQIMEVLIERADAEVLELFLNYFNPFEHGTPSSIYSISNSVTFYSMLWYMHTARHAPGLIENAEPDGIVIHKVTHSDFDVSLEFYSVLFILSESSGQFMNSVRNEIFTQISRYLQRTLDSVRSSREYLLSNYSEISCSIDEMVSNMSRKNNTHKAAYHLMQHNLHTVIALSLYLLNSSKTFKNLQEIQTYMELPSVEQIDLDRAHEYGIASKKNAKKMDRFAALTKRKRRTPPAEIDLSSVTEHSISTNLDTNIIEGMSKIDDTKQ